MFVCRYAVMHSLGLQRLKPTTTISTKFYFIKIIIKERILVYFGFVCGLQE